MASTTDFDTQIHAGGKPPSLFSRSIDEWYKAFAQAFLPVGYPHSVSDDYLAYQTYDSLQAFFSTITSLLASRALLEGLGVGDADSSATYAMLLTIMKDATSRVATIVFAHRFGLRIEPEAKKYRFLADLFNDTAFFLELANPFLGPWGKALALGTGQALRALCGVAAGASKAALSVHFAKQDNLAELNAKEASQETAVGLIGLLVGTLVVRYIEDHRVVVCLMIILVFAHLWMNYLGVRCVAMNTLNRQRATILFQHYQKTGDILSPRQVAQRESILFWTPVFGSRSQGTISFINIAGTYTDTVKAINKNTRYGELEAKNDPWILHVYNDKLHGVTYKHIIVCMQERATRSLDVILAWASALRVAEPPMQTARRRLVAEAVCEVMASAGWNLDTQNLETGAPLRIRRQPREKKEQ